MKLSIIVPGIRTANWKKLYDSVDFKGEWEIIFVGPDASPFGAPNLQYRCSYRSPCACQQIGLMMAEGEYISWAADDGVFLPGALDHAVGLAKDGCVPVGKYLEGENPKNMESTEYYYFKYHDAYKLEGVPPYGFIFNCGVISNSLIRELGGWDAENFECTTMAHADLGIRVRKHGKMMVLMDKPMFKCSHLPNRQGDHFAVHNAMKKDIATFRYIYSKPNDRINIELNNWQYTEERWKARFK
jgi:hypothetical protein